MRLCLEAVTIWTHAPPLMNSDMGVFRLAVEPSPSPPPVRWSGSAIECCDTRSPHVRKKCMQACVILVQGGRFWGKDHLIHSWWRDGL